MGGLTSRAATARGRLAGTHRLAIVERTPRHRALPTRAHRHARAPRTTLAPPPRSSSRRASARPVRTRAKRGQRSAGDERGAARESRIAKHRRTNVSRETFVRPTTANALKKDAADGEHATIRAERIQQPHRRHVPASPRRRHAPPHAPHHRAAASPPHAATTSAAASATMPPHARLSLAALVRLIRSSWLSRTRDTLIRIAPRHAAPSRSYVTSTTAPQPCRRTTSGSAPATSMTAITPLLRAAACRDRTWLRATYTLVAMLREILCIMSPRDTDVPQSSHTRSGASQTLTPRSTKIGSQGTDARMFHVKHSYAKPRHIRNTPTNGPPALRAAASPPRAPHHRAAATPAAASRAPRHHALAPAPTGAHTGPKGWTLPDACCLSEGERRVGAG